MNMATTTVTTEEPPQTQNWRERRGEDVHDTTMTDDAESDNNQEHYTTAGAGAINETVSQDNQKKDVPETDLEHLSENLQKTSLSTRNLPVINPITSSVMPPLNIEPHELITPMRSNVSTNLAFAQNMQRTFGDGTSGPGYGVTSTPIYMPGTGLTIPQVCQPIYTPLTNTYTYQMPPPTMGVYTPRQVGPQAFHARAPTGYTPMPAPVSAQTPKTHLTAAELQARNFRTSGGLTKDFVTSMENFKGTMQERDVTGFTIPPPPTRRNVHWKDKEREDSSPEFDIQRTDQRRRFSHTTTPMSAFFTGANTKQRTAPNSNGGGGANHSAFRPVVHPWWQTPSGNEDTYTNLQYVPTREPGPGSERQTGVLRPSALPGPPGGGGGPPGGGGGPPGGGGGPPGGGGGPPGGGGGDDPGRILGGMDQQAHMWQNLANQLQSMTNVMNMVVQNQARSPKHDRNLKKGMFPTLDFTENRRTKLLDFVYYRMEIQMVLTKNPWIFNLDLNQVISAILDDMGPGKKWAMTNFPAEHGHYGFEHIDPFYDELKRMACGPAVDTLAETDFEKFVPDPEWTPKNIGLRLKIMWECAFQPHNRAWTTLHHKYLKVIPNWLSTYLINNYFSFRGTPSEDEAGFEQLVNWAEEIICNQKLAATYKNDRRPENNQGQNTRGGGQRNGEKTNNGMSNISSGGDSNKRKDSRTSAKYDNKEGWKSTRYERAEKTASAFKHNEQTMKKLMDAGACFRCRQPGHLARNCPDSNTETRGMNNLEGASEDEGDAAGEYESSPGESDGATMSRLAANATSWFNLESMSNLERAPERQSRNIQRRVEPKNETGHPHLRLGGRPHF